MMWKTIISLFIFIVPVVTSCISRHDRVHNDSYKKITFDLSRLDDEGLYGPGNGRRALSYEFCIPDTSENRREVSAIDTTVRFMPGVSGRIGCEKGQCLCIGSTHQTNFKTVLKRLAELQYVERIDECFFE